MDTGRAEAVFEFKENDGADDRPFDRPDPQAERSIGTKSPGPLLSRAQQAHRLDEVFDAGIAQRGSVMALQIAFKCGRLRF